MSKFIRFFCMYNLRSWKNNKLPVIFSAISISVGTAMILAVQLISLYNLSHIEENAITINDGEINITLHQKEVLPEQLDSLQQLSDETGIDYTLSLISQGRVRTDSRTSIMYAHFIDIENYPIYDKGNNPLNKSTSSTGNRVALSNNVADRLSVGLGDEIRIFSESLYETNEMEVIDIVSSSNIGSGDALAQDISIFGSVYLPISLLEKSSQHTINKIYINTNDTVHIDLLVQRLQSIFPSATITTYMDALGLAEEAIHSTTLMLNIIGFIAFSIAGVTLAKSMFFLFTRRRREISILKVLGLKSYTIMFSMMLEAIVISFIGNVIGLFLGVLFSNMMNQIVYGRELGLLPFEYLVLPVIHILLISFSIALIFTFIPILMCNKISVFAILRERELESKEKVNIAIPILLMAILIGALFSIYLNSIVIGLATLIIFCLGLIFYFMFSVILKIISGIKVSDKITLLVLRNLGRQRKKLSLILIVMLCGMMSTGITFSLRENVLQSIIDTVHFQQGYNVIVSTKLEEEHNVLQLLESSQNISNYYQSVQIGAAITAINEEVFDDTFFQTLNEPTQQRLRNLIIGAVNLNVSQPPIIIREGRNLSHLDAEENSIIISHDLSEVMSIYVGDTVQFDIEGHNIKFEVVGIQDRVLVNTFDIVASLHALEQSTEWDSSIFYVDVDDGNFAETIQYFYNELENVFVLDLNETLMSLGVTINQQIGVFFYVSVICIIAFIFMTTTTTLIMFFERGKEFVVLKVMGATNKTIFKIIFWESLIMGLIVGVVSAVLLNLLIGGAFMLLFNIAYTSSFTTSFVIIVFSLLISSFSSLAVSYQLGKSKNENLILRAE